MKHKLGVLGGLVSIVVAGILAAGCRGGSDTIKVDDAEWRAAKVNPPYEMPLDTINDTSGQPYNIREETEDTVTLLYIGYTHCPDICPVHVHDVNAALQRVDPEVAEDVTFIFLTADPERDTAPVLREWLDHFNTEFVGLVPTQEELASVLKGFSMNFPAKTDIGGGNYTVSHAAYVIAFTKDGFGGLVYPSGMTIDDWVHDLPLLVKARQ